MRRQDAQDQGVDGQDVPEESRVRRFPISRRRNQTAVRFENPEGRKRRGKAAVLVEGARRDDFSMLLHARRPEPFNMLSALKMI